MMDLLEHWTTNRWAWWWTPGWTYELHSVLTALGVMKLKLDRDPPHTQYTPHNVTTAAIMRASRAALPFHWSFP